MPVRNWFLLCFTSTSKRTARLALLAWTVTVSRWSPEHQTMCCALFCFHFRLKRGEAKLHIVLSLTDVEMGLNTAMWALCMRFLPSPFYFQSLRHRHKQDRELHVQLHGYICPAALRLLPIGLAVEGEDEHISSVDCVASKEAAVVGRKRERGRWLESFVPQSFLSILASL